MPYYIVRRFTGRRRGRKHNDPLVPPQAPNGASGPDEFGAFFFQKYWQIIKEDVTNVVLEKTLSEDYLYVSNNNNIRIHKLLKDEVHLLHAYQKIHVKE